MPKTNIDYSNTIIYKLCCNDPTITDIYIGHTTNFTKRKNQHKFACYNRHDSYVYQFICKNGGWENWNMIILDKVRCIDGNEARQHERRHIEDKKAMLNINMPIREYELNQINESKEALKKSKEQERIKLNEFKHAMITCECGIDIERYQLQNHLISVVHRNRMDGIHWVLQPHILSKYSPMKSETDSSPEVRSATSVISNISV